MAGDFFTMLMALLLLPHVFFPILPHPTPNISLGKTTAREVWTAVENLFNSQSHARVIQLRYQLATISKGSSSISDYYRKLKHLSDIMSAAGTPLTSKEFISYLLAGLSNNYDALVTSITTRLEPLSPETLYNLLLTHECRLVHSHHLPATTNLSANLTTTAPSRGRGGYHSHNHGSHHGHGFGCTQSFNPPLLPNTSTTPSYSPLPHS
ncbi:uncharacterized protein LOC122296919 [Carya illinoinensis]|uniref:uncharacterized protein LOC122296919 n=1 Tax=Carya illinoinensis TaxID=32201 RepID=UPI001C721A5E|nr:uncharacterized protein LOC122296919 [Carya illinoinensis]